MKKTYIILSGLNLMQIILIENLLSDEFNDLKIFDKNFYFDIMIDQVFLIKNTQ